MLFNIVCRWHNWLGLLVALPDAWHYWLASWNLVLREQAFRSVPAQVPLGPTSEVQGIFSSRFLSSPSVINQELLTIAFNVFEVSWTVLTNNSKEIFSCLLWKILLDGFWLLKRVLSVQMRIFPLNYMCISILRLMCSTGFRRQIVINMIPCDFFRHPYYYFNFLFPFYVFISVCLPN